MATARPRSGTVDHFDEAEGLGTVRDDEGTSYPFHCTAIVDGTRTIAVDTAVTFRIVPARVGRWEATSVRPR